jgi:hypothetical protein
MIPNVIKKVFFEHALELGEVAVRFDGKTPGVKIPEGIDCKGLVTLVYGLNQPKPIPDLTISEAGISATLSFNNAPHPTFVPWEEVRSIGGEGCAAIFMVTPAPKADPNDLEIEANGRPKLRSI